MKFMGSWREHTEKRQDVLKAFSQMTISDDKTDMGDKIKLIGRWHDISQFTGVAIYETEDQQASANWILNWNGGVIDIVITPVLDDEEVRAIGKKRQANADRSAGKSSRMFTK